MTIGNATLYLGDCRHVLQEIRLPAGHVVVTDPVWPNVPPDSVAGSDDPWGLWETVCGLIELEPRSRMIVVMRCDSDPRFLNHVPPCLPFFRSIQLPYVMPGYLGRVLGGDETAYWFGDPIAFAPGRQVVPGRAPAAQPSARPPNGHPMSRAQVHFDWLLHWCSDAGETVFDPFMGSGTTGVSCIKLGRPFVGIEVEPRFFDIACRRIEEAQRQADLFIPMTQQERAADAAANYELALHELAHREEKDYG